MVISFIYDRTQEIRTVHSRYFDIAKSHLFEAHSICSCVLVRVIINPTGLGLAEEIRSRLTDAQFAHAVGQSVEFYSIVANHLHRPPARSCRSSKSADPVDSLVEKLETLQK